jgi:2-phospho-L-lactate guanylyltransferase
MMAATVVPQDPAPMTATDVSDPTVGSVRAAMFPDSARAATCGVVIPIRAFALGKARLAGSLDEIERASLARRWAEQVVGAAGPMPVVVVSSDPEVRAWADDRGLDLLADPGSLDAAATVGRDAWRDRGCARAIIAHADLPRARDLVRLARDASRPVVGLVPCHRDDGTPVLSVPTEIAFEFAYGPGSFRRHAAHARSRGLAVRVLRDADLAFDVDLPADLEALGVTCEASAAP